MFIEKTSVLYQARYCAQEEFSIAVCLKKSINRLEYPYSLNSHEDFNQISVITKKWYNNKVVACGSDLFVLRKRRRTFAFEKYSESSESKTVLSSLLDNRLHFCVCSFMQRIYVIGGNIKTEDFSIDSCMCYDIECNKWTYIAPMIESRRNASCEVFEGKIVVTGGYDMDKNQLGYKSVEAYCSFENEWTQLPDMLEKRRYHGTVSIGNKLFVIGRSTCEVFDSITNKFVFLKSLPDLKDNFFQFVNNIEAVSIGYKIYVYREFKKNRKNVIGSDMVIYCYNGEQNDLVQENNLQLDFEVFSCAKMFKK